LLKRFLTPFRGLGVRGRERNRFPARRMVLTAKLCVAKLLPSDFV
jgi:hypothetical protein